MIFTKPYLQNFSREVGFYKTTSFFKGDVIIVELTEKSLFQTRKLIIGLDSIIIKIKNKIITLNKY